MDRYKIVKKLGEGTFGSVWQAINIQNGEIVAVKKMKRKYYSWEECLNLREVKSLRKMNHANIMKLKEVIRELDMLYFVFEYMDCNIYQLMKRRGKGFSEAEVKTQCLQVFQGLAYMHLQGYFHRDLKPENLLVSGNIVKIADFGLVREINSLPPYTEYVSTRWYRAPEVMLRSPVYSSAVDMWAMGAIIAELFTSSPLFPGSSEADQMYRICSVMGTPTKNEWVEGLRLASAINYQFPQCNGVPLSALVPSASEDAINLIMSLCSWDPCKRPTALEVLRHPFFQGCYRVPPSLRYRTSVQRTPPSAATEAKLGHKSLLNLKPASIIYPANPQMQVAGLPYKVEVNYQGNKTDYNLSKADNKPEPRYCFPARNFPTTTYQSLMARGVIAETAEMLANMSVGSDGGWGWYVKSDPFLRQQQQEIYPATIFTQKAGG